MVAGRFTRTKSAPGRALRRPAALTSRQRQGAARCGVERQVGASWKARSPRIVSSCPWEEIKPRTTTTPRENVPQAKAHGSAPRTSAEEAEDGAAETQATPGDGRFTEPGRNPSQHFEITSILKMAKNLETKESQKAEIKDQRVNLMTR